MKIKHKLTLGVIFLFALLTLSCSMGIFYLVQLKDDAQVILKNNYESLHYCQSMFKQLDSLKYTPKTSLDKFEYYLNLQQKNITEKNELEATVALRNNFDNLKTSMNFEESQMLLISHNIQKIIEINMEAMAAKYKLANKTAESALGYITLITTVIFLIAFTFVVNFPSMIANPVTKLTEAIKEIASKNYKHRIYINNKDEFGELAASFNLMAQKLDEYEHSSVAQLMFEKSRAEAIINCIEDASIGIDKNNVVLFVNQQALSLLNMQQGNIVGKNIDEIKKHNDLFKYIIENTQSEPFKIVLDQKESYFVKENYAIKKGEEELGIVFVLKNITAFLEKDEAKTHFLAVISHELKTPIASIKLGVSLLENSKTGNVNAEQKILIDGIKEDSNRLLKITGELLSMSQIETGKINLEITSALPETLIDTAIQSLGQQANDKQIEIIKSLNHQDKLVQCDPDKTAWVLINLLSNAIRYSPENGKVKISTQLVENKIYFSVEDQGRGIPIEYQERIFDKYFQIPGSSTSGTGLGLAISKEFLIAMNGEIQVKSELGKGSVFIFDLNQV